MAAGPIAPIGDGSLVETEGVDDGLERFIGVACNAEGWHAMPKTVVHELKSR